MDMRGHFSKLVVSNSLRTPWTAAHQASLSITNSQSLLKLMSIESVMPSNHLIFCHPLLLLPLIFPSIRVFSNEFFVSGGQIYWSFSFSISPSNQYSGLISFRKDWFELMGVRTRLQRMLSTENWCFPIVILQKTFESPLDCKEIKPVSSKGNQPWIFTRRTDAEAEAPIIWPPDVKCRLTGKDSDAGKEWRQ